MHRLDGAGEPAAVERQLAFDDRIAVIQDPPLQACQGHHERLGLDSSHPAEALRSVAQTLNPQGAIRIQHDLNHGLVAEPGQDLRSQLPSQLLVEPLARLGTHIAVQHREHSSRPWLFAHEDVKKNCPGIRFTVFSWQYSSHVL